MLQRILLRFWKHVSNDEYLFLARNYNCGNRSSLNKFTSRNRGYPIMFQSHLSFARFCTKKSQPAA